MSMYGAYPKVEVNGELVEQNGLNGAPKAWPVTDCSKDERLTVQAAREETDINSIMRRIEKGKMVPVNGKEPIFADISYFDGLADAVMKVKESDRLFMELPANVRARFENDPVKLVAFLEDEGNRPEAEELGLVVKREVPDSEGAGPSLPPSEGNKPA